MVLRWLTSCLLTKNKASKNAFSFMHLISKIRCSVMTQAKVKQKRSNEKLFFFQLMPLFYFSFFMCVALSMVYNNIVVT